MITVSTRNVRLPLSRALMIRAAGKFLKRAGLDRAALSLVFLSSAEMRQLNRKSLGHDYVTDVITFDLRASARDPMEGEIYICPDEAKRNAVLYGQSFRRELFRYVAHGILHLKGFDDGTELERSRMRSLEDEMLDSL